MLEFEAGETRLRTIRDEREQLASHWNGSEARLLLAAFAPVWESLSTRQQRRRLFQAVELVGDDGTKGKLVIRFRPLRLQ